MMRKKAGSQAPLLEWLAGGVGLVFLVLLLGVIGYDAVSGTSREPPAIIVKAQEVARSGWGYVLVFEAVNLGGGTAAAVQVEGQLLDGATVVETSTATIDYVAGHGSGEGGLFFMRDPRGLKIQLRPLGYQTP